MPELPDVVQLKRYFDATSLHQEIAGSHVADERILENVTARQLSPRLKGSAFAAAHRHGKFLFAELSRGGYLVLHFGMTGELHYYKDGDEPRFTRLLVDFDNGRHLAVCWQRMLGEVNVTDDRDGFIAKRELGPDALADGFGREAFVEALSGRRGSVKAALMNQSIVAGIGNVYSDEILFQARRHPATTLDQLDEDDLGELYRVMRRVLQTAVRHDADTSTFPRSYLLRDRDQDGACPECGGELAEQDVSGRTARFCPRCQKKRG